MDDIATKLSQEVSSSYTPTEKFAVSSGPYSLTAKWGKSSRPGELRGKITCSKDSTKDDGEMTFDVFLIKDAPTFMWLKQKKPEVDGDKLCAEVGNLKNITGKPGVGSACVYMLALIAERVGAPYIMISSSIADGFYQKVGCETFSRACNDMFGLTPTVKTQAQSHMK